MRPTKRWDRRLWGVVYASPMARVVRHVDDHLIGSLWHATAKSSYAGEPTRALLFSTRHQARAWCAAQNKTRSLQWKMRVVKVRETVTVFA